ncbi:iron-containing alcohol dehydrogenase [Oceanobacillus sp. CF4.6]|uniref:iron-containing alcohol dehydrogenase n=1 Tax=Oceanobacillus sp. CF4.6 TaxID=3373080 RepID=UPI003EE4D192
MKHSSFKIANKLITGEGATTAILNELEILGVKNPLIITDTILIEVGVVKKITDLLDGLEHGIFTGVKPEPEFGVVEECMKQFKQGNHDGLIAVGGGSAIDIAKAVSGYSIMDKPLKSLVGTDIVNKKGPSIIAIPTTAGTGSEVTNIAILADPEDNIKKGIVSDHLLPDVAIVAPEMTLTMPPSVTAASGVDALVHAIESYISLNASPITDGLALQAIKMISKNLPKAFANPTNLEAREQMATASLIAGMAFGNAGVAAVHALAYPIGGKYHIAHGVSNALLLPFVMEWNKIGNLERFRDIAIAMGENVEGLSDYEAADKAVNAMQNICKVVNIPSGLRHFNILESDIEELANEAMKIERLLKNNPRKFNVIEIKKIYQSAF